MRSDGLENVHLRTAYVGSSARHFSQCNMSSEYGRAYSSRNSDNKYMDNRRYCYERRRREHLHTPICWESDSTSDDDDVPVTAGLHDDINNGVSDDRCGQSVWAVCDEEDDDALVKILNDDDEVNRCAGTCDTRAITPGGVVAHKNLNKHRVVSSKLNARIAQLCTSRTPSKVKTRKQTVPQGRQSAEPPFITFGCRDEHRDVGTKLTHNVRASSEIHSSALTAMKRLAVDANLKREQKIKKKAQKMITKGNNPIENNDWLSEYQLRFPAYDRKVYVNHLSGRRHVLLQ